MIALKVYEFIFLRRMKAESSSEKFPKGNFKSKEVDWKLKTKNVPSLELSSISTPYKLVENYLRI